MALPPARLVRKGRINLGQTHLIFELDYRKSREHASSGRKKNDGDKFVPDTRLEAPVQIYGSDFLRRIERNLAKKIEKGRFLLVPILRMPDSIDGCL
jgi:hypothetical protein